MLNIDADREQTGWPHGVFSLEGWGVLLSTHTWNVHQDPGSPEHPVGPPQPRPPSWALSPSVLLASSSGHDAPKRCSPGWVITPGTWGRSQGAPLGFVCLCAGMCAHVWVSVCLCLCMHAYVSMSLCVHACASACIHVWV